MKRIIIIMIIALSSVQFTIAQMVGTPYIVPTTVDSLAATITNSQTICSTATPQTLTGTATGGTGTYTYQWQRSSDSSTWTNISGATAATYAPGSLAAGIYYYRLQVTGGGKTVTSNAVTLILVPSLKSPTITLAGPCSTDTKIFAGGTATMTASVPRIPGVTYSWTVPIGLTVQSSTDTSVTFTADEFYTSSTTSAVKTFTVSVAETGPCSATAVTATSANITAELIPNTTAKAKLVAKQELAQSTYGFYVAWTDINGVNRYYVFGTKTSLTSYDIAGITCQSIPNSGSTDVYPLVSETDGIYVNFSSNISFDLVQLTDTNGKCNVEGTYGGGYINLTGSNYQCGKLYPATGGLISIGKW